MSLDLSRLENVRQRGEKTIARCPACAEHDNDQKGEHLVIMPDGRFGCVTCPGAAGKAHRQRIFALAGNRTTCKRGPCVIRVRRPARSTLPPIAERPANSGECGAGGTSFSEPRDTRGRNTGDAPCGGESLPGIAGTLDTVGRIGRVSQTLALRVNESIKEDGEEKIDEHTRSIGVKASNASSPSSETPTCCNDGQTNHAAQDIDPETGFPIIGGAVCPF